MRTWIVAAMIGLGVGDFHTAAQGQQGTGTYLFGFERMTCAAWLADRRMELEGETWVVAFWAGMNFKNPSNHEVGRGTDMRGIWDAVKLLCRSTPTMTVLDATVRTYDRLQGERR